MAKWLNKYFSLGNSKTKSPPQPPRPDYREQRRRGERPSQPPQAVPQAPAAASASCGPATASCFSASSGSLPDDSGSTSDLIRAYRAQKERDFEDPYNGPGSSLRKLRAMCRLDYCGGGGEPGGSQRAFSASSASGAAGCCCASSGAGAAASSSSGSPHLYRSSERRPTTPAEVRYISPKHRLIKVESAAGAGAGDPMGGACSGGRTWSPTACGSKKLLNKCAASATEESGAGKKDKVTIADDYSDPFDAKNDLKNKVGKGESAGYMEPYEAQRIMTEFQRQESVRSEHKSIQLYDTPYEPDGQSVDSDSESAVSLRLRESKLPQDDDRPADEYDQPWEWNRVTIPALAAQFNGTEKRQASPSPSRDRRRQLRAPGGGFKPIKHGSPEFCGILGERVDPAVPLEKQIWYHGAISRGDAESLLRLCKECSYLVRNSQTSKHDYSLSLKSNQGFMHMKLAKTKEKYVLGQNSPPFDSVPEVIHYYTTRKLPIKGAEHLSLLYPVAVRTL
ncbi:SH2 domain-containing adapter protein B [Trichechus inunguis]|uniref:SH2 domain-containing adapter protein B n=1 Tax=Trichechus manatus latirostris TaxID=127582 RepID=A0A2Y9QVD3_TRIMA|nr:SH2 domain-containing adapter protein B [Trichechus manatus latirostris]